VSGGFDPGEIPENWGAPGETGERSRGTRRTFEFPHFRRRGDARVLHTFQLLAYLFIYHRRGSDAKVLISTVSLVFFSESEEGARIDDGNSSAGIREKLVTVCSETGAYKISLFLATGRLP